MKRYLNILLYISVLLLPVNVLAIDLDDPETTPVTNAKAFVKNYPKINDNVDELGLVNLWQRIEGLHNLISVWETDPSAFNGPGPAEIRSLRWQILKRIYSHFLYAKYDGNDEQVKALVAMIRLHAIFAERYMNDQIRYTPYADVAEYAKVNGSYLAEQVEKKYTRDDKATKTMNK